MNAYKDDPRVDDDGNPASYYIRLNGDRESFMFEFVVFTNDYKTWWSMPADATVGSGSSKGPFGTADEAIHSVIGDPL